MGFGRKDYEVECRRTLQSWAQGQRYTEVVSDKFTITAKDLDEAMQIAMDTYNNVIAVREVQ